MIRMIISKENSVMWEPYKVKYCYQIKTYLLYKVDIPQNTFLYALKMNDN